MPDSQFFAVSQVTTLLVTASKPVLQQVMSTTWILSRRSTEKLQDLFDPRAPMATAFVAFAVSSDKKRTSL
jgi:hypothetical protein